MLVKIIDELGVDTTATVGAWFDAANAGGEARLDLATSPRVVKDPLLGGYLPSMLDTDQVTAADIDVVLIPIRDLGDAAASRWLVDRRARRVGSPGGLNGVKRPTRQADYLADELWALLLALELHDVRWRLMHYPRFMVDRDYFVAIVAATFPDVSPAKIAGVWDRHSGRIPRQGLPVATWRDDLRALWWEAKRRSHPLARRIGVR